MITGVMVTTPRGSRFWVPAKDEESGKAQVREQLFVYAAAWDELGLEFGAMNGQVFKVTSRIQEPAKAVTA